MQVVTKKSQSFFEDFKALPFINLSCQEMDSEVLLGRVRKTSSRRSGALMRRPKHKKWKKKKNIFGGEA